MQSAMAVPPRATTPEKEREEDGDGEDEFTFPTPPPQLLGVGARARDFLHLARPPCAASASSSPPVWLLSSSSPIRRSFSAADCAASPWRDRVLLARRRLNGGCSPALSDYAARAGDAGFCEEGEEEEEERMDSLWEDLNDDDAAARGEDLLFGRSLDVSRRRSVAAANAAEGVRMVGKDKDHLGGGAGGAVLGASRSSRRRAPGLVAMMRSLRRMFVAHKGKSRVHRDEQSIASASAASAYSLSRKG